MKINNLSSQFNILNKTNKSFSSNQNVNKTNLKQIEKQETSKKSRSLFQKIDNTLYEIQGTIGRMSELVKLGDNETLSLDDKEDIQIEIDNLKSEITKSSKSEEFDKLSKLTDKLSSKPEFKDNSDMPILKLTSNLTAETLGLNNVSISNVSGSVKVCKDAINLISSIRTTIHKYKDELENISNEAGIKLEQENNLQPNFIIYSKTNSKINMQESFINQLNKYNLSI